MTLLFRDAQGLCRSAVGSVVCIGAFDGVHLGHQKLLAQVRGRAEQMNLQSIALTFSPLPREFFMAAQAPPRISNLRDRLRQLQGHVDQVGLLRFNANFAAMSPEQFAQDVLQERLNAKEVWTGEDFRFGHQRQGDVAALKALGETLGFAAQVFATQTHDSQRISSTRVRKALSDSDFAQAEKLLGRAYRISGRVVRGQQLGRELGFPTANLRLPNNPVLTGVFAVRVIGITNSPMPAVASLGVRPTVNGTQPLLEVHVFDFSGDLYGRCIEVEFVQRLRAELKFDSLPALVTQMHQDSAQAREQLAVAASQIQSKGI